MSRVLAAALSKPSQQKVLLFPITTSTSCLFMCSERLTKVVSRCQKPSRLTGSAPWEPAISQNLAGFKPPLSPAQRIPPNLKVRQEESKAKDLEGRGCSSGLLTEFGDD